MILDLALSGGAPDGFPPHPQCSGIGSGITGKLRSDTWATPVRYELCAFMPVAAQATSVPRPSEEEILNQAEEEVEQGRFDEALDKCRRILRANPHSAYAYYFNQKQLELIDSLKLPKLPSYPTTDTASRHAEPTAARDNECCPHP